MIRKEWAALKIQRKWRAYKSRRITRKREFLKDQLYGMKKNAGTRNAPTESIRLVYENELLKKKLDSEYLEIMTNERVRLLQERAPQIMEDISDHVRAWFREFYDKSDDFHPYPDAINQGTVLVLLDESMNIEEFKEYQILQNMSKEERKARAEKQKQQKLKEREKIKKQKLKDAKRRKKLSDAGIYDIADQMQNNKDIEKFEKTMQQYSTDWRNVDEYLNRNHSAILEWVTENVLSIVHKELRALVDEYMRLEYELLKQAWCLDKKKKYKPSKQPKVKNKSAKKGKKRDVDHIANRTMESLYHELRESGIIEKRPNTRFNAFKSDFNYVANETRDEDNMVSMAPTMGDIKMVIQECMFGLGEFEVDKPKSLCIVGPESNGKELLCNIISYELDAIFMNLSPENTHQFAKNLNYLIDMVMKVAREFQPTILFIQNAHRIFWKKIPKDQLDICPTLLQSAIIKKMLKSIKKTDKIMLLGTSDAPWEANAKFKKAFQKILMMPKTDYGTAFLLWLELISQVIGEEDFEGHIIPALAKVFHDYNTGDIVNNINKTLDLKRRMRLHSNTLSPIEFLDYFIARDEPIFPPQEKLIAKFEKWFSRTNTYSKLKNQFLLKKKNTQSKKK